MPLVAVVLHALGLVRAPETDQVRCDRAKAGGHEDRDHLAVEVGPGRLAVQHQHRRRWRIAFVDVGHAQVAELQVFWLVREIR